IYADQLVGEGVLSESDADELAQRCYQRLATAHSELKDVLSGGPDTGEFQLDRGQSVEPDTKISRETLVQLNEQLVRVPEGFTIHRKLKPQIERRRQVFAEGHGIEWAHAEALAFASLLVQGVPVRLTGQDTERRTVTRARGPSTRAAALSASFSSAPRGTCASRTRRRPRSTSTSCAARRSSPSSGRWS